MHEDEDVTNKFLHVIRDKRREKYGRMLYGSDGTVEVSFFFFYFSILILFLFFIFVFPFCFSFSTFLFYSNLFFVFI
jgi:hypothetical protein